MEIFQGSAELNELLQLKIMIRRAAGGSNFCSKHCHGTFVTSTMANGA